VPACRRPSTRGADRGHVAGQLLPRKKAARELNATWRGFHFGVVRDVVVMSRLLGKFAQNCTTFLRLRLMRVKEREAKFRDSNRGCADHRLYRLSATEHARAGAPDRSAGLGQVDVSPGTLRCDPRGGQQDLMRDNRRPARRQRELIERAFSDGRSVVVDNTNPASFRVHPGVRREKQPARRA
jgi:hypothetical protein